MLFKSGITGQGYSSVVQSLTGKLKVLSSSSSTKKTKQDKTKKNSTCN